MKPAKLAVVILAAGQGTRMKSAYPKVLHEIAGKTMLDHVLDSVAALEPERIVVVVGAEMDQVAARATGHQGAPTGTVVQDRQLGTGHALACAKPALEGYFGPDGAGDLLVVFGDTPLLTPETLRTMAAARAAPAPPDLLGLAFRPSDPGQYGRVVLDPDGRVTRIVEYADASAAERALDLCNGGVVLGQGPILISLTDRLGQENAKGEFYLTEIFALAGREGRPTAMIEADPEEVMGINTRADLAVAEAVVQIRLRARAMSQGATLIDPNTVWLSMDTRLGRDVTVHPNVRFGPGVAVHDGAEIRGFCDIEGATIEAGARIGPFARLRPGARVGTAARVGNFVEVKNATLGPGAKANHLSYLGDAEIGAEANIGAGTITCNYDGIAKHRSIIGRRAFIGSNTALVAPVTVGEDAIIGAGSTITRDVSDGAVAVARGTQRERAGAAKRFRARRRAAGSKTAKSEKPVTGD